MIASYNGSETFTNKTFNIFGLNTEGVAQVTEIGYAANQLFSIWLG
jgi:hypothetical protein